MADVKCIVTHSAGIERLGEFEINEMDAVETRINDTEIHVTRKRVSVSGGLSVVGLLFGPRGLDCKMDVFVGPNKINEDGPIKADYKSRAECYLFNWSKR